MMKRKILVAVVVILAIVFTALALETVRNTEHRLQLKEVQLQERGAELKKLELDYRNLNVELDKTDKNNNKKIDQLEREKRELDEDRKRLERELQAKLQRKEQERLAKLETQENLINTVTATQTASATPQHRVSGNKESWLRASGIPESEWWAVDSIVSRESGWQPCAFYPSKNDCNATPSSACGLAQSLPCGKQSKYGHWTDPVANLKWQYEYVKQRYGGYAQAVAFWNVNHWY